MSVIHWEWVAIGVLYLIGLVGLHATARDLNGGPIRTVRAWINLICWPATITFGKMGDIYDAIRLNFFTKG